MLSPVEPGVILWPEGGSKLDQVLSNILMNTPTNVVYSASPRQNLKKLVSFFCKTIRCFIIHSPPEGAACSLPMQKDRMCPINWKETEAAKCIEFTAHVTGRESRFYKVASFIAAKGDKAKVGTYVVVKHGAAYQIGTVKEILYCSKQQVVSNVVISLLEFLPELHARLHVPCIKYPVQEQNIVVSPLVSCFLAVP